MKPVSRNICEPANFKLTGQLTGELTGHESGHLNPQPSKRFMEFCEIPYRLSAQDHQAALPEE